MATLELYTRQGCHLCENAEALLHRLGQQPQTVDVDLDATLRARYGDEVPVVAIDGVPVLSGIIREPALRTALARAGIPLSAGNESGSKRRSPLPGGEG